jgi:hypothetical protein
VTILQSNPQIIRNLSEYMFTSSARIATLTKDTRMIPNRLQPASAAGTDADVFDVFLLDPSMARLSYLHGYRTEPLAKTGLADKRQMAVDWTVKVLNEEAHAVIADVDQTEAVVA